jgi:hypothetical protein
MRRLWVTGVLALAALCATACSTPGTSKPAAAEPPSPQAYREAVDALIAATRTQVDYLGTSMREVQFCRFALDISPGRQSILQFAFDVRQLDVNAVSAAEGQVAGAPFSRRIACAKDQGFCTYYTGMPYPYVDIPASTAEDMDRALRALRALDSICRKPPPLF